MTDDQIFAALLSAKNKPVAVHVVATDYSYQGWCVIAFMKRSGAVRCVVEDENGRLFVHNAGQIAVCQ